MNAKRQSNVCKRCHTECEECGKYGELGRSVELAATPDTAQEGRTVTGQTVGLIDAMLSIARALAPRLKMSCGDQEDDPILDALRDFHEDKAVQWIWRHCPETRTEQQDAALTERMILSRKDHKTEAETLRLRELDELAISYTGTGYNESRTFDGLQRQLAIHMGRERERQAGKTEVGS